MDYDISKWRKILLKNKNMTAISKKRVKMAVKKMSQRI